MSEDTTELPALRALLHQEGEHVQVSLSSWQKIHARLPQTTRKRQVARGLLPLLAGATAVAVVATVAVTTSGGGSSETVVPGTDASAVAAPTSPDDVFWTATGTAGSDPAQTARSFVSSLGLDPDQLTADPLSDNAVIVRQSGRSLGRVELTRLPSGTWGVTGMASAQLTVRNPATDARFDPPMSVAFRSSTDGDVLIHLYASGRSTPLSTWQGTVDGGQDWFSQSNFPQTQARHAYVALVRSHGEQADAVTVVRVQLGEKTS
jgi:hypothetical protein